MNDTTIARIEANPKFAELVRKKTSLGWTLSLVMLVIYYGFILVVAFSPATLGQTIAGTVTLGIPLGVGIILSAFVLTGIYVRRANREFDQLNREIVQEIGQ
ncbi:DUF485 domain-containing protein [Chitinimonas lacunae]|uniref:DUF485 domain-containing protein n=1 Tax=Chitinimonas lacunae TaxID=1963018 RepID=A0ABV8MSF3_9NEIS